MAFTWQYSFEPGKRIEAAGVVEIYDNINAIADRVDMTLTWNYNPVSAGQIVTTEQVEELRENVDTLYDCSVDSVDTHDSGYDGVDSIDTDDIVDSYDSGHDTRCAFCSDDAVDSYDEVYSFDSVESGYDAYDSYDETVYTTIV